MNWNQVTKESLLEYINKNRLENIRFVSPTIPETDFTIIEVTQEKICLKPSRGKKQIRFYIEAFLPIIREGDIVVQVLLPETCISLET